MTSSILDNVEHWRGRAKAARLIANHLADPVTKAAMLTIEQYELIAEQAQVRSHDEAPEATEGQDIAAAPCEAEEEWSKERRRLSAAHGRRRGRTSHDG